MASTSKTVADAVVYYSGHGAVVDVAQGLAASLSDVPGEVTVEDRTPGAELGAGEVILSLVVTALAKASAMTVLTRLRSYLQTKIASVEPTTAAIRLRVDVNQKTRVPLEFRQATLETIDDFCGRLEKIVGAL